ncbi:sphingosine-1-phosphate phosphatase 1-like, partial [Plakobranchus ocellatus]
MKVTAALVACIFYGCFLPQIVSALEILRTFREPDNRSFQHLRVHPSSGDVYLGGTDRLYRLGPDLSLSQSVTTGPREDNPSCPPPPLPCQFHRVPTSAYTKALLVDDQADEIIVCTSLYHGQCQTFRSSNITLSLGFSRRPVVPSDPASSCVVFSSTARKSLIFLPDKDHIHGRNYSSSLSYSSRPSGRPFRSDRVLYVGAEYSNLGNDRKRRHLVPSISRRMLPSWRLASRDSEGASHFLVRPEYRDIFRIEFVYGFTRRGFAYFLTTQPESVTASASSRRVTRLSRICEADRYFRSYVEIPLACHGEGGLSSLIARAASVTDDGDSLIMSFSSQNTSTTEEKVSSSVCVFSMEELDRAFNTTVEDCYRGRSHLGPQHYHPRQKCTRT